VKPNYGRIGIVLASAILLASCASTLVHRDGLRSFERGQYEVALQKMQQAADMEPDDLTYRLEVKGRREEAVQKLIAEGDKARASGDAATATAAYQRVLSIEPGNVRAAKGIEGVVADQRHAQLVGESQKALQRGDFELADAQLRSVLAEDPGYAPATALRAKVDTARGPVTVTPRLRTKDSRPVTLQFRDAQTKMVFEVLSRQTGINFIFDKDVKDGKTTIFVRDVPIEQAIDLVLGQNQLSRQVLSDNMVLIYPTTAAKQKDYQDQIVKTFYLNTALPKDVESLLKTVLGAKTLVINERANAVIMRDTPETVRMAEKLVASVDLAEPEVMMEVEVLEITRSRLQQLGIAYPTSATLSTPKDLFVNDLAKLNGSNISVTPLSVTLDALKTSGVTNVLASPRIRARNKEKAKVLIGSRVPVITTAASSSGNGGVINNTQVQYLDVGLTLDVEPTIYADNDVGIKVNLEVSSITNRVTVGETIAYEIGTRNATTLLQLKDGETQILAGLIRDSDSHSSKNIPGLGDIPVVGRLFGDHNSARDKTEVVLSITPRIIRAKPRPSSDTTEFWYGTEARTGLAPLGAAPPGMAMVAAPAGRGAVNLDANAAAPTQTNVSTTGIGTVVGPGAGAVTSAPGAAAAMGNGPTPGAPLANRFARFRGAGGVSAVKPVADGSPPPQLTTSLAGPNEVNVGDEFTVTVNLQTDQNIARVRAQMRFDINAFQFVSGDPGDLVASAADAKVGNFAGGAQIDATAATEQPVSGSGELMTLKFKALRVQPQAAFAAVITAMNAAGVTTASSSPEPLMLSIKAP
jgi:general secretion pathway protein D